MGGMARLEGFEPPTNGFGSHYSIRLSYRRVALPIAAAKPAFSHGSPVFGCPGNGTARLRGPSVCRLAGSIS